MRVTRAVGSSLNLQEVLDLALTTTLAVVNMEAGSIRILNVEGTALEYGTHRGFSQELVSMAQKLDVQYTLPGHVVTTGRVVVCADIPSDPRCQLVNRTGEGLRVAAFAPLKSRGRVLGTLCVASSQPMQFGSSRVRLLAAIGEVVGVAVENALLHEKTRVYQQRVRGLLARVMASHEAERARISREIHDSVCQSIAAVSYGLNACEEFVLLQPERAMRQVSALAATSRETLAEIRRIVSDLRPPVLDHFGLVGALRQLVAEHRESLPVRLRTKGASPRQRWPEHVEIAVYRVVQEALTNVRKHAAATAVSVRLTFARDGVRIRVLDNGCGFEFPGILMERPASFGLIGMRERAEAVGGSFKVKTAPDQGTVIEVWIPAATGKGGADGDDRGESAYC